MDSCSMTSRKRSFYEPYYGGGVVCEELKTPEPADPDVHDIHDLPTIRRGQQNSRKALKPSPAVARLNLEMMNLDLDLGLMLPSLDELKSSVPNDHQQFINMSPRTPTSGSAVNIQFTTAVNAASSDSHQSTGGDNTRFSPMVKYVPTIAAPFADYCCTALPVEALHAHRPRPLASSSQLGPDPTSVIADADIPENHLRRYWQPRRQLQPNNPFGRFLPENLCLPRMDEPEGWLCPANSPSMNPNNDATTSATLPFLKPKPKRMRSCAEEEGDISDAGCSSLIMDL